ncbi:MAG: hypothetical protein K6L80_07025 [Agarilytica sp.]
MEYFLKYSSMLLIGFLLCKTAYDAFVVCFPGRARFAPAISFPDLNFSSIPWRVFLNHPYVHVTSMVLVNRALLIVFASLVYSFLEGRPIDVIGNFDDVWYKWDTRHFLYIAEHGYPSFGELKTILVYYPMYPFLVRGANLLFDNYFTSAVVVSFCFLILACIYLYKLALLEFGEKVIAKDSVKYLLLFPLSLFASMAYTESTFMAFSVACFYYIRRQLWFVAGLFGMFAAITRNQGILLFAPFVYEAVRITIEQKRANGQLSLWVCMTRFTSPLLILCGFGAYLAVNKGVSGDWFQFLEYQKVNWGQEVMFFADNIANIYNRVGNGSTMMAMGTWIPSVSVFVFCLGMMLCMARVLPTPYVIYSVLFFVVSYSPSWLISGARYMFALFPVYMVLARLISHRRQISQYVDTVFLFYTMIICMAFIKHNVY